jgi:hypothetical protein
MLPRHLISGCRESQSTVSHLTPSRRRLRLNDDGSAEAAARIERKLTILCGRLMVNNGDVDVKNPPWLVGLGFSVVTNVSHSNRMVV